jgi:hypothetical protein
VDQKNDVEIGGIGNNNWITKTNVIKSALTKLFFGGILLSKIKKSVFLLKISPKNSAAL